MIERFRPPCPYCGERQNRQEASPTKPRVITTSEWVGGKIVARKKTDYGTECRACHQRIYWCVSGNLGDYLTWKSAEWRKR